MIIVLSGPSGTGKSRLARHLLEVFPTLTYVASYTTRSKRLDDKPFEYHYLSQLEFDQKRGLICKTKVRSENYGRSKAAIDELLQQGSVPLMTLTIDGFDELRHYYPGHSIKAFFISAPNVTVLRQRLAARGDSSAMIQRQIAECHDWLARARRSGLPYIYEIDKAKIEYMIGELLKKK